MGSLTRKLGAEFLGSLLLAALVIGSGIAAQRLSPGDVGLQLLENAAGILYAFAYLALFAIPIFGAAKLERRPPMWLRISAEHR